METSYDVIVVGARCAGSPTAMLLARKGYRVLLVDRATFPSDTLSTHVVQPLGIAALKRWGLLARLAATGCPSIHTYAFDFGPVTITGSPGTAESPVAYCPRRTVLDKLLVDAAADAGADVREGFQVDELLIENDRVVGIRGLAEDGTRHAARATVVVGADGRNSFVARAVQAESYNARPALLASYYSYWSGLPLNGRFEIYIRERRGFGAAETHDGLTMLIGGWPVAEFEQNKKDVEGNFLRMIELAPAFADRLRGAKRESRLFPAVLPNFFRKPYGAGWVLVGDAAYHKDSITAQGITDAFREAERCADALDQALGGTRPFDQAMADCQRARDEHVGPMYDFTCQVATLEPPPLEMQKLIGAIHGRQEAMDAFIRMNAGTISPRDFFAPQNLGALMAAAA
jgi:flavin-dependent dehydrogenase